MQVESNNLITAVTFLLMKHSALVKEQPNSMDLTELLPSQDQTEAHCGR